MTTLPAHEDRLPEEEVPVMIVIIHDDNDVDEEKHRSPYDMVRKETEYISKSEDISSN
jgi:hypothetical protein